MPKIIIEFDENGDIIADAHGFEGASCEEALDFLNEIGVVTEKTRKAEWYRKNLNKIGQVKAKLCG